MTHFDRNGLTPFAPGPQCTIHHCLHSTTINTNAKSRCEEYRRLTACQTTVDGGRQGVVIHQLTGTWPNLTRFQRMRQVQTVNSDC